MQEDLKQLLPFCTAQQREKIEAVMEHGSHAKAARALGCHKTSVTKAIDRVRKRAAKSGIAPESGLTHPAPAGYFMPKTTVQVGADGKVIQQWARFAQDAERQALALEAIQEALADSIKRERPRKPPKGQFNEDLLNLFIVTDYHLGMSAWGEQTGANWDVEIAENTLVEWFSQTIARSERAHTAVLCQLGDFFHYDSLTAVTPASGHVLDADTRYQKMIQIGVRLLRRVVSMLLETHQCVHLVMAEGNHDEASSAWLRVTFEALYENEPRVTIDRNPDPYYCFEWGDTSLFFHHGHKRKPEKIDDVFAAKFRSVFGRTKYSYAHLGHLHHYKGLETNLMIVQQHPTLAAADAYASSGGWMSRRAAQCITYHKRFGHWSRIEISAEQLAA